MISRVLEKDGVDNREQFLGTRRKREKAIAALKILDAARLAGRAIENPPGYLNFLMTQGDLRADDLDPGVLLTWGFRDLPCNVLPFRPRTLGDD
jgi:hypothetical protein